MRNNLLLLTGVVGLLAATAPASALSMKECSAKYQAAKQTGTTTKWNDFRKAECSADASPTPATAAAPSVASPAPTVASTRPGSTVAMPRTSARASTPSGSITYPSAIDPKYSSESAGKGRMHTCLDSYKTAKASGTLGDAKWIQKGGGYYSACNAHLKG